MIGTARLSSEAVCEVIDLLVRQRQPARLTSVAAELGVSPRTVQRAMAADGDTFSRAVNESRLYEAAYGLIAKSASVRQAGEMAGFATTSDFCAVFKAWSGVSPGAFRLAVLRGALSSHEISAGVTREAVELFEELMSEHGPSASSR